MSNSIVSALRSSSSRLSFAVLGALVVSASAGAELITTYNSFQRYGVAGGVGAIRSAAISTSVDVFPGGTVSVTRPNGSNSWTDVSGSAERRRFYLGNNTASSDADYVNWMQSNQVGNWQFSFDYGNGAMNHSWDSAPHYLPESDRNYLALTASSATLVDQIRLQGLTGTFTFHLAAPISGVSSSYADVFFGGQRATLFNGPSGPVSSFTLTFNSAISTSSFMRMTYSAVTNESILATTGFGGAQMRVQSGFFNETVYGIEPVPAPGAIALFGLVGLAGRRRR
jgi:hypothetical protein